MTVDRSMLWGDIAYDIDIEYDANKGGYLISGNDAYQLAKDTKAINKTEAKLCETDGVIPKVTVYLDDDGTGEISVQRYGDCFIKKFSPRVVARITKVAFGMSDEDYEEWCGFPG